VKLYRIEIAPDDDPDAWTCEWFSDKQRAKAAFARLRKAKEPPAGGCVRGNLALTLKVNPVTCGVAYLDSYEVGSGRTGMVVALNEGNSFNRHCLVGITPIDKIVIK